MTDGQAYLKERKDILLFVALVVSLIECLTCLLSISVGIRLSFDAANKKFRKKEGAFFVQVLSEKDIVVVSKPPSSKQSGSIRESSQSFGRSSTWHRLSVLCSSSFSFGTRNKEKYLMLDLLNDDATLDSLPSWSMRYANTASKDVDQSYARACSLRTCFLFEMK